MRSILCALLFAFTFTSTQIASAQTAKASTRKPAPAASSPAKATTPTNAAEPCPCAPRPQHVQPYTAKQQTTRVQTLADGTKITNVEEIYLARDAAGRTRRETVRTQNGDTLHFFEIFDYVTQTRYSWNVGRNYQQIVNVYHQRPNPQPTAPQPAQPQRYYPYHSDSLPPQTIDGLYVEGTRYTRTTPAGYAGNDHDIVTTTESWYVPSLSLQMRIIMDDPRNGKSTTETTDVKQTDPDPALFLPPVGYQLKDSNP